VVHLHEPHNGVARLVSVSVQATFCAALVDEWERGGVTDVVVCPGSRSTPMALALARRLRLHVRLDERSAAFYALGLAMATGRPTVICTTSGTAAAELHAAVVEAHHGCVPLIVCTADRPPELQQVGASQTIDQVGIFTTATRWAHAPGIPDERQQATWRPLAVRALAEALDGPVGPGPVHLNLAFREPLIGEPGELPPSSGVARTPPPAAPTSPSSPTTPLIGRGLIVAGARATTDAVRLLSLAEHLGWPLLADPRSGCRVEGTIAAADAIVRAEAPLPDTVLLIGESWLSKALAEYLTRAAQAGARVISVDPWWQWRDPTRIVTEFHHMGSDAFIAAATQSSTPNPDSAWLSRWQSYETNAQAAIDTTLGREFNEPQVARHLARHASQSGATIVVSASMPMRDLEWFAPALPSPPPVLANRGANGIDGVVSTALGVAASGRPTIALLGDLAFLHDVSGLVHLPQDLPCTFVVLDNSGGGIFSFLPQAAALPHDTFEQLFGTPPTADISAVASGFGLDVHHVSSLDELDDALVSAQAQRPAALAMIRASVPGRTENVSLHDTLNQAVRLAVQ
jgi:2-succinyl-5-enolpyruvyl-6-hydroxy-3-cyclohexene-1-carboxylate synthase